jgi:hypothetical protein
MPQFINKIIVPSQGSIRHIIGFGQGDAGYDVIETISKDNVPVVVYYYIKNGIKHSVSVTKYQKRYFVDYETYIDLNSLVSYQKKSCSLNSVSRDYLMETVMAYRAYRMLFNEYTNFRDDIMDALNTLECVYLGGMAKDSEHLISILERSGFHVESVNFGMIKTKEGICLSFDGLCFNQDEIIP